MHSTNGVNVRQHGMRPIFFGSSDRRLFGVYHTPQREPAGRVGVVICQSIGHEYVRSHRALRNLAAMFARRGFPVLRFDYFGCGDSAGDSRDLTLGRSIEDAGTASAELRRLSGARTVSFVGQRFGAAVALLASSGRADNGTTILWDPVVRGSVYLQDLADLHAAWMHTGGRSAGDELASYPDAVLGFTVSLELRAQLMEVDLPAAVSVRSPAAALQVIVTEQTTETPELTQAVKSKYGDAAVRYLSEPPGWREPDLIHTALAAPQTLQSISTSLLSSDLPREVSVRSTST